MYKEGDRDERMRAIEVLKQVVDHLLGILQSAPDKCRPEGPEILDESSMGLGKPRLLPVAELPAERTLEVCAAHSGRTLEHPSKLGVGGRAVFLGVVHACVIVQVGLDEARDCGCFI